MPLGYSLTPTYDWSTDSWVTEGNITDELRQQYRDWLMDPSNDQATLTDRMFGFSDQGIALGHKMGNSFFQSYGNSAMEAEPEPSLADYMSNNPDLSVDDYFKFMAQHSDEWAEKYLDLLTERGELENANQYTAEREDTAYQRLVEDLKRAGLNPAMMYGSSASPQASPSQGYVRTSEGANSRAINNYSKLKKVLLDYMMYELKKNHYLANDAFKGISSISQLLSLFI